MIEYYKSGDRMLEIVIASHNPNKVKEIKEIYPTINFKSLADLNIYDEAIEDGTTFKENAYKKAYYIASKYNVIALADDSGLCCLGLNLEPGVHSARYAKNHDDNANNLKLVEKIKNIKNKKAYYACAICICLPNGVAYYKEKRCYGKIVLEPKGSNGFGYDPYFYLKKYKRTMAEITLVEKNKISHRAKALRGLRRIFRKLNKKYDNQ